jgi:hypothetical protein
MIKQKFTKIALVVGIAIASQNVVYADFNIYADPNVVAKKVIKQDKHSFKQIGGSLEKAKVVNSGSGPLSIAIDHLIPEGWEVKMNPDVGLENSIVKWKGNVTWPYALESLSINHDMNVVINWERQYVTIDSELRESEIELSKIEKLSKEHNLAKKEINLLALDSTSDKETDLLMTPEQELEKIKNVIETEELSLIEQHESSILNIEDKIKKMEPKEKYELEKAYASKGVLPFDSSFESFVKNKDIENHEYMQLTFVLKSGLSLQDNIRGWVKEMPNDWTLEWDAKKDFMIDKDVNLKNTFIDVFPVVENFYKDSKYPIKIKLYLKNTTVHVYNKELKLNHKGANIK